MDASEPDTVSDHGANALCFMCATRPPACDHQSQGGEVQAKETCHDTCRDSHMYQHVVVLNQRVKIGDHR